VQKYPTSEIRPLFFLSAVLKEWSFFRHQQTQFFQNLFSMFSYALPPQHRVGLHKASNAGELLVSSSTFPLLLHKRFSRIADIIMQIIFRSVHIPITTMLAISLAPFAVLISATHHFCMK
jgi:hypothetical protein